MSHAPIEPVAIAILAKAPVPGIAKTRLMPILGADGAARLQARLIERTLAIATAADIGPVTLWAAPDPFHPAFQSACSRFGVLLKRQPQTDLGTRMQVALAAAGGPALVIGTDCPALAPRHLQAAAEVLRRGIDAVLIPAQDGGYVLIGARQAEARLFTGIAWGGAQVAAQTRRRLARLGWSWREPARLWDIDRPEDLERLKREGLDDLLA